MISTSLRAARADAVVAIAFAVLAAWAFYSSFQAAAEEVRRHGFNVDSGANQFFLALFYLAPASLLFAISSVGQWRSWRLSRGIHWVAFLYAIAPFVLIIAWSARRAL